MERKTTKISSVSLKRELEKVMDKEMIGPTEIEQQTKVPKQTIYAVLKSERAYHQRDVVKKIAEGLGYDYVIKGSDVELFKRVRDADDLRLQITSLLSGYVESDRVKEVNAIVGWVMMISSKNVEAKKIEIATDLIELLVRIDMEGIISLKNVVDSIRNREGDLINYKVKALEGIIENLEILGKK